MQTAEFLKNANILANLEKEFENILACLSGAHMGSNHEKISWYTPFKIRATSQLDTEQQK